jgi:hypothetical protein
MPGATGAARRHASTDIDLAGGYGDDPLRYEKALIDGWTERELQPAR